MQDTLAKISVKFVGIVFAGIMLIYCLDVFTVKYVAPPVLFPFTDGECLTYEISYPNSNNPAVNSEVCFKKKGDNFIEYVAGPPWLARKLTTTYNLNGFSVLSQEDIDYRLKAFSRDKNLPLFLRQEEEKILRNIREHSKFFGPADLKPGDLFYNKFPVKEFSEYNGEPVYVVEIHPWENTQYRDKGLISKLFLNLFAFGTHRRQQFILGYPKRAKASDDLIERHYYSRNSGVLVGSERLWVSRDIKGNIVSEDSSKKELNVKMRLIREAGNF